MVVTKSGNKLCVIDEITETKIHFANKAFELTVDANTVFHMPNSWRGANFHYNENI